MFSLTDKPQININRRVLEKVFPDNESLRKFEELLRLLNNLVPEDLANIYSYIEDIDNNNSLAISKLNSTNSRLKNIIDIVEALINSVDTDSSNTKIISILSMIKVLQNTNDYLEKKPNNIQNKQPVFNYVDFDLNANLTQQQGRLSWNSDDVTLNLFLNDFVTLQIGQETLFISKNTTGSTILNGALCSFSGTIGASGKLKVKLGIGSDDNNIIMGIATQDIINNDFGFVTHFGLVRGINTTGSLVGETWADGNLLYPNPTISGALTNIQPAAPYFKSPIATVIYAHSNIGSIFVRMKTGEKISTLHDVNISGLANNHLLKYNSTTQRWENVIGASGTFTTTNLKTVTVVGGLITSIV